MEQPQITPHLFRTEYSKIVAVLCRTFHLRHIEIAEDIASETFLKASEAWPAKGLPENPTAWLYAVAKNKAKDYLKRAALFETGVKPALRVTEAATDRQPAFEFDHKTIADSQLEMLFAVCSPVNAPEAQISLALQILCGFSVEEIANAFLAKPETVKKRLQRAREKLRAGPVQRTALRPGEINERLETVLKTLYLLFNEGYFSRTDDRPVRKELCFEALRLTRLLTGHSSADTPAANALLALLCFQSSRLDARTDGEGDAVLFDDQDQTRWDKALVENGNRYLIRAFEKNDGGLSKYHLEAAIAYWHTTAEEGEKWQRILPLYDGLVAVEPSPGAALSRAFALAKVHGHRAAIDEVERLNLADNAAYHGLLGYLYAVVDTRRAIAHYGHALRLTNSRIEKKTLSRQMERLQTRTMGACSPNDKRLWQP